MSCLIYVMVDGSSNTVGRFDDQLARPRIGEGLEGGRGDVSICIFWFAVRGGLRAKGSSGLLAVGGKG